VGKQKTRKVPSFEVVFRARNIERVDRKSYAPCVSRMQQADAQFGMAIFPGKYAAHVVRMAKDNKGNEESRAKFLGIS